MTDNNIGKTREEYEQELRAGTEEDRDTSREEAREDSREESGLLREVLSYIRLIAIVVIAVVLLQSFVLINAKIPSESMETTIMTGDHIFGNRLVYRFHDPERYDIVIFRYPDNEEQLFIKRIIGLPGDVVEIIDGQVYVNGADEPLDDSFCSYDALDSIAGTNPGRGTEETNGGTRYVVPEDCYFMLGDNRDHSKDSRYWDQPYVAREKILGKAFLRYWPLNRISIIKHDQDYYQPPASGEGT